MIRFKFGLPQVTISSLAMYTSAILEANLLPPPEPKNEWKSVMDSLSDVSCAMYRDYVREQPDFVPYFRAATPELELGKLPLGSSKRNVDLLVVLKHYVLSLGFLHGHKTA